MQMTLTELNEHLDLVQRFQQAKELLQNLWDAAEPGAQNMDGMPHSTGVSDKVGNLASEIADMEADMHQLEQQVKESEAQITSFIFSIDDLQIRLIFRLRFIRGMRWQDVATTVGGKNTEESVKMACYRYLAP